MNFWLKWLLINLAALALATVIGVVALSQVYVLKPNIGRNPAAPLIVGFVVSLIVAIAAPATRFMPRFMVLSGIFVGEFLLSILAANANIFIINTFWDGDVEAATPWIHGGIVIPFITGITGYLVLRRYRLPDVRDVFR